MHFGALLYCLGFITIQWEKLTWQKYRNNVISCEMEMDDTLQRSHTDENLVIYFWLP